MSSLRLLELPRDEADLVRAFRVVRELRTHLDEAAFLARVTKARAYGYLVAIAEEGDRVVGYAGFRLGLSLHDGPYVYVDDLVTETAERSKGIGRELLAWVAAYGRAHGHDVVRLDSGVTRHAAHRFYLRERFDIVGYHFARRG